MRDLQLLTNLPEPPWDAEAAEVDQDGPAGTDCDQKIHSGPGAPPNNVSVVS